MNYYVYYLKNKLRPYAQGPLRKLFDRARGIVMTPLTHEDIATLINKPEPTILEIGCNDGSDTLEFLRVMPRARIYCFEPDRRAIARFKSNLGSQHENVKLFEFALSNRNGVTDFYMSTRAIRESW